MRTCGAKHEGKDTAEKTKVEYTLTDDFVNPKSLANWQGALELNNKSDAIYHKYYKLALDYENQKQFNKDNTYIKFKDIKDTSTKYFLKYEIDDEVVRSQIKNSTDVVIPQYNSPLVQKVLNSNELKDTLNKNLTKIRNGDITHLVINYKSFDLKATIGHGTIHNLKIVDDCVCGTHTDYYNFDNKKYADMYYLLRFVNNNAYKQQQAGMLKNYLIIFPFRIPIAELSK